MAGDEGDVRYAASDAGNIAYRVIGSGPIDIVFSGGFGTHLDLMWAEPMFHRFANRLASFARVICFDKRGTGLSDPIEQLPTVEERARDWAAVMDAAGSDSAFLVGHSEAGTSALYFAATAPDRVEGLILASSFVSTPADPVYVDQGYFLPDEVDRLLQKYASIRELIETRWGTGDALSAIEPEVGDGRLVRQAIALLERSLGDRARMLRMWDAVMQSNVRELLPAVQAPTLVFHRDEDLVPLAAGRFIADHIAGAEFHVVPGSAHAIWIGETDVVIDGIERFVTGREPTGNSDRALVTMLFTDIVDSTALAHDQGEAWVDRLQEHNRIVQKTVDGFGGRVVKWLGDGAMVTLPGPVSAVRCAAAISSGLERCDLRIRAGVHVGEVEVLSDGDLAGVEVHRAARVMAVGASGQIVTSTLVRDLACGGDLEFVPFGAHELKGIPGEHALFLSALGTAEPADHGSSISRGTLLQRAMLVAARRAPQLSRRLFARLLDA